MLKAPKYVGMRNQAAACFKMSLKERLRNIPRAAIKKIIIKLMKGSRIIPKGIRIIGIICQKD